MAMQRVPVQSSNIVSVGYAEATKTLQVEFSNGAVYEYTSVEPEMHAAFMASDSKGRFFTTQIRSSYLHARVTDAAADVEAPAPDAEPTSNAPADSTPPADLPSP